MVALHGLLEKYERAAYNDGGERGDIVRAWAHEYEETKSVVNVINKSINQSE